MILVTLVVVTGCGSNGQRDRVPTVVVGVNGEANRLRLTVASCQGAPRAEVVEGPSRVTISVTSLEAVGEVKKACADAVEVALKEQLGHRAVVDATTGRRLVVNPAE